MADFPSMVGLGSDEFTYTLGPLTPNGSVSVSTGITSAAWPSNNLAIYMPVRVSRPVTVYKMATGCGTTAGGNFDMGIYTWSGTRLVSTGTQARSANNEVIVDVTDTTFGPGRFWMAMSADSTGIMSCCNSGLNAGIGKMLGFRQQATAFVLPSTATFATSAQSYTPLMIAILRSE